MPKHKQSQSLGNLSDFRSEQTETETETRLNALERRLSTVELLLNDVLQHLDGVSEQPKSKSTSPPVKKNEKKQKSSQPAASGNEPSSLGQYLAEDVAAIAAFLSQTPEKIWAGRAIRLALKENCPGISNKRLKNAVDHLKEKQRLKKLANVEVDGEVQNQALQWVGDTE